uniref:High mobility group box 1b n=1 Tax=Salarias fasciatus TaxID=181472 RepID=A0A672J968_SALFA
MGKIRSKKAKGQNVLICLLCATCREEHKKKHPDASVTFSEFSKKCSERWKTMYPKEKGKFEDLAKQDKVRYEREMKNYHSPPRTSHHRRLPSFAGLRSSCSVQTKSQDQGRVSWLSIGDTAKKLGELWNRLTIEDKQPYEKNASKMKDKYDKVRRFCRTSSVCGTVDTPSAATADDDDDEDEDEDEEEDDDDDDDE